MSTTNESHDALVSAIRHAVANQLVVLYGGLDQIEAGDTDGVDRIRTAVEQIRVLLSQRTPHPQAYTPQQERAVWVLRILLSAGHELEGAENEEQVCLRAKGRPRVALLSWATAEIAALGGTLVVDENTATVTLPR